MKYLKLFEQFIVNESKYSPAEFVKKYSGAKTIQAADLVTLNVYGVVHSRSILGEDDRTFAVGKGEHSYLAPQHSPKITSIEVLEFDKDLYEELGVVKKHWKSIQKQGGLIQVNVDTELVIDKIISTVDWFENFTTIK